LGCPAGQGRAETLKTFRALGGRCILPLDLSILPANYQFKNIGYEISGISPLPLGLPALLPGLTGSSAQAVFAEQEIQSRIGAAKMQSSALCRIAIETSIIPSGTKLRREKYAVFIKKMASCHSVSIHMRQQLECNLQAIEPAFPGLKRFVARLTRANPNGVLESIDENLAVSNLSGASGFFNSLYYFVALAIGNTHLNLRLRNKVETIFRSPIALYLPFLPTYTTYIGYR
jgi:hypothetical protein